MSYEQVGEYLRQFHAEDRMITFTVSSATVPLAAQALHGEEARIAKTLSFLLKEDACVLLVAAGDARIDNQKFKAVFHEKARMLPPERVEEMTGHPVGGVPFQVQEQAPGNGIYCTTLVWQAWQRNGLDWQVPFTRVDIPWFRGRYLLPSALAASPRLQRLVFVQVPLKQ